MNRLRLLQSSTIVLASLCLAVACSQDRAPTGSRGGGGGGGGTPKDTGVHGDPDAGTADPDGSTQPGPDTGMQTGCDHNPSGCADRELRNPQTCACLAICEQGWTYNAATRMCDPTGSPDGGTNTGNDGGGMMGFPDAAPRPDTGPYDGGVPTSDPFDVTSLATTYAQRLCAYQTRCVPAIYPYTGESEADCIAEQAREVGSTWSAYTDVIAANRVGFSQAAFDRCMNAFQTADCALGLPDGSCDGIFTGSQAAGQPCSLGVECTSDTFCTASPLGACGMCAARAGPGQPCNAALCQARHTCAQLQDGSTACVPNNAGENQTCFTIQTGFCRGQLQCVGNMNFQCMRPATTGQVCDPMRSTGPDCNLSMGEICNNGTCAAVNFVGANQSCAPPNFCDSSSRCDSTANNTCVAWPTEGATCFQGECADGFYCDVATCTALKGMGAACMASAECADELYCINGTCGALTYNLCQ